MAARLESVDEAEVVVESGEVRIGERRRPSGTCSSRGLGRLGGEVIGLGETRKEADPDHPLGGTSAFFEFNCTAVEVEVDRETGDVTVTRHVTVSDVGKALNPTQVRGQDEGAAVMGLGHTLMERLVLDDDGPDPATSAPSTTGSRRRWTCRCGWRATSSRTATGRARTARRA